LAPAAAPAVLLPLPLPLLLTGAMSLSMHVL
jgi:hypothetical protein